MTDAVAVLAEFGEAFEIVEQPFHDGLETPRVHVREAVLPFFCGRGVPTARWSLTAARRVRLSTR